MVYDLTEVGGIVYSKGKYLIRLDLEGREQVIETADLVNRGRVRLGGAVGERSRGEGLTMVNV